MGAYETSVYTTAVTIAILLGASIGYFVVSVSKQKRYFLEQQRKYFTDEINLLEKDRSRTAHDLHDEIGPLVSAMRTLLQVLRPVDEKDADYIKKMEAYTGQFLVSMRRIAINLSPTALAKKGLAFALGQLQENLQELYTTRFVLVYDVRSEIDEGSRIHLYRIVQELLHNTIKHAKASEVRIHFKERKGRLYLVCSDDGSGFAVEDTRENSGGFGLSSLRSRTSVLRGSMQMESKPGEGTRYVFEFPFPKQML